MIELTLPAGSFASAIQAYLHGADAVYLGLTSFSARKGAQNFTLDEVAKLKTLSLELHKKFYITINTLLDDQEIAELIPIIKNLELLQVDAIIVQDLGLASIIHNNFPTIPLHASTQLAVHSVNGVNALVDLGFSRVVLARELTLDEIKYIRNYCPDVSLKVFIHGAMCYGFSGLCMASSTLTERSANKGECAQICRSWFTRDQEGEETQGYFFSMKDLSSPRDVIQQLINIGIDSLKVEGRMKSPEYVALSAQYYRMLIDGEKDENKIETIKDEMDTSFARIQSGGWLSGYDKTKVSSIRTTPSLITTTYPGHYGVLVGSVIEESKEFKGYYLIKAEQEISVRDGLLITYTTRGKREEPIKFSAREILDRSLDSCNSIRKGEYGYIEIPGIFPLTFPFELRRISLHNATNAKIDETHYLAYRYPITITLTLDYQKLTISSSDLPAWLNGDTKQSYSIDINEARKEQQLSQNIETIFTTGLHEKVIASNIIIKNNITLPLSKIFIPLSALKEVRRSYYEFLEDFIAKSIQAPSMLLDEVSPIGIKMPKRSLISPPNSRNLPYSDLGKSLKLLKEGKNIGDVFSIIEQKVYIPLPAVFFNEKEIIQQLDEILNLIKQPVVIGVNNISHIQWLKPYSHIETFIDVYFYIANRESAQLAYSSLQNLIGGYYWIEKQKPDTSHYPIYMSEVEKDFSLPLFISRSCYRYDVLGLSCQGCTRNDKYEVSQRENNYLVEIHNCISVVSKK